MTNERDDKNYLVVQVSRDGNPVVTDWTLDEAQAKRKADEQARAKPGTEIFIYERKGRVVGEVATKWR